VSIFCRRHPPPPLQAEQASKNKQARASNARASNARASEQEKKTQFIDEKQQRVASKIFLVFFWLLRKHPLPSLLTPSESLDIFRYLSISLASRHSLISFRFAISLSAFHHIVRGLIILFFCFLVFGFLFFVFCF